jgi:hypothetical protein
VIGLDTDWTFIEGKGKIGKLSVIQISCRVPEGSTVGILLPGWTDHYL